MHSPVEIKNDKKNRSIENYLLDFESLIQNNFPKLPAEPKDNDSEEQKSYFYGIEIAQKIFAEIFAFSQGARGAMNFPDHYQKCSQEQKKALRNLFEMAKILSLCISYKLESLKNISSKIATQLQKICEECHYLEINIKDPQGLTQNKKTEIGKILDHGLEGTGTYTGISGARVQVEHTGKEHTRIYRTKPDDSKIISVYRKRLESKCKPPEELNNKKPINPNNLLIHNVEAYVMKYPRDCKKQPFLISVKEKKYDLAMRIACDDGCTYLLNLLLDSAKNEIIKLNLNAPSSNGKTALHWAAESAGINDDFECVKSLLAYTPTNGEPKLNLLSTDLEGKTVFHYAAISCNKNNNIEGLKILFDVTSSSDLTNLDFIKDKQNNLFDEYLNYQLKLDMNDYSNKKYISDLTRVQTQASHKI